MYTAVKKEIKSTPKPRLVFVHPGQYASGSAFQVELHPATSERQGYLMIEFVEQEDDEFSDTDGYHHEGFDWSGSLKLRLNVTVVGKVLRVLNGSASELNPIFNRPEEIYSKDGWIDLRCHRGTICGMDDSPVVSLTAVVGNKTRWMFDLNPEEILVLRHAIEGAMPKLAWGN